MDNNKKEIVKNIGEAAIDSLLTIAGTMTFGISTNIIDFADKIFKYHNDIQKIHSLKQLQSFYETPSRLNKVDLENFKKKNENYTETVLDLMKSIDLTINKKQAVMLAKLLELYILGGIDSDKYEFWKHIVIQLNGYFINEIQDLYNNSLQYHINNIDDNPDSYQAKNNKLPAAELMNFGFVSNQSKDGFAKDVICSVCLDVRTREFYNFYNNIFKD